MPVRRPVPVPCPLPPGGPLSGRFVRARVCLCVFCVLMLDRQSSDGSCLRVVCAVCGCMVYTHTVYGSDGSVGPWAGDPTPPDPVHVHVYKNEWVTQ